ncbi:uncharacterized protein LOC111301098 [Durio zibethinus]|uniref:Uncharacterized protein LOC111301098 n=1 Tax=Durio zibethinus TaxID=66656 RepID=A0A6P5ZIW1_DURZI|nr:uncharacterized protein LOC111301098 [Durio zibethinus]
MPNNIVSDRNKVFTSMFWKGLFKLLGTELKLSTSYHPQTDGQSEVYNTSHHTSIQTTPYEVAYGQPVPTLMPYLLDDSKVGAIDRSLQARETTIQLLKFPFNRARNRMKQQAEKHKQLSMVNRPCLKLAARFFGLYKVLDKVGFMAYRLKLPERAKVHLLFHVSLPKKNVGNEPAKFDFLPLDRDGTIAKEPIQILDRRMNKKRGKLEVPV